MILLELFEVARGGEKFNVGQRYQYWADEDVEPNENIKLRHYIKDLESGKTYEPDWSPYSSMTPTDVQMYAWLVNHGGEPSRQESGSNAPLNTTDLKKIAVGRRSSMRESQSEGNYSDKELDELNNNLRKIITTEFGGRAWVPGGSYAYLIDVRRPQMIYASDDSRVRVQDWARGLKDYIDPYMFRDLIEYEPTEWKQYQKLLPAKKVSGQAGYEGGKIRGDWYEDATGSKRAELEQRYKQAIEAYKKEDSKENANPAVLWSIRLNLIDLERRLGISKSSKEKVTNVTEEKKTLSFVAYVYNALKNKFMDMSDVEDLFDYAYLEDVDIWELAEELSTKPINQKNAAAVISGPLKWLLDNINDRSMLPKIKPLAVAWSKSVIPEVMSIAKTLTDTEDQSVSEGSQDRAKELTDYIRMKERVLGGGNALSAGERRKLAQARQELKQLKSQKQGVGESKISNKAAQAAAADLVKKMGYKKAFDHAIMMANLGRDPSWLPVIRHIQSFKNQGMAEDSNSGAWRRGPSGNLTRHSMEYAVWSQKSPGEQAMIKQNYPNLKILNVPKPVKPTKEKIDYSQIAQKIENVLGNTFPDGDPLDWLIPYMQKRWAIKGDAFKHLNLAAKKHLNKGGYYKYLENSWDDFADDNPDNEMGVTRESNPWRTNESMEEGYNTSGDNREHFDDLKTWTREIHRDGGDVFKGRGILIAVGWDGEIGEFDPKTSQGWKVASYTKNKGVAESTYTANKLFVKKLKSESALIEHAKLFSKNLSLDGVPITSKNRYTVVCSTIFSQAKNSLNEARHITNGKQVVKLLKRLDQFHELPIKIGTKVAIINSQLQGDSVELWGFTTPKTISKIYRDPSDKSIKQFEFNNDPNDVWPRTENAEYNGQFLMYSAFFGDKKSADQALTTIMLQASGDLDIRNHIKEQDVSEGLRDPKDNPCWKGYKPVGTKKKSGRTVPNCVPVKENEVYGLYSRSKNQQPTHRTTIDLYKDGKLTLKKGSELRRVPGSSVLYVHLINNRPAEVCRIDSKHCEPINEETPPVETEPGVRPLRSVVNLGKPPATSEPATQTSRSGIIGVRG